MLGVNPRHRSSGELNCGLSYDEWYNVTEKSWRVVLIHKRPPPLVTLNWKPFLRQHQMKGLYDVLHDFVLQNNDGVEMKDMLFICSNTRTAAVWATTPVPPPPTWPWRGSVRAPAPCCLSSWPSSSASCSSPLSSVCQPSQPPSGKSYILG